MYLVDVVKTVKPEDRTAEQWGRLGRNHGDACIARMMRQNPLPRKLQPLYLDCVIAGLNVEATKASFKPEHVYWISYIDVLYAFQAMAGSRSAA